MTAVGKRIVTPPIVHEAPRKKVLHHVAENSRALLKHLDRQTLDRATRTLQQWHDEADQMEDTAWKRRHELGAYGIAIQTIINHEAKREAWDEACKAFEEAIALVKSMATESDE